MVDEVQQNLDSSQGNHTLKKRSLLEKYEISINHLSYEYINKCENIKELERIVKILRSGEEGFYPDLEKKAVDRLRLLNPTSRQLRVEEPVLTSNGIKNSEWNSIMTDVSTWSKEISISDMTLLEESNKLEDIIELPVRQSLLSENQIKNKTPENKPKTKHLRSYEAWDKYDADTELLKMDLDQKQWKRKQQQSQQTEIDRFQSIVNYADKLTDTERQLLAEQDKNRGNEYYQEKNYDEAIKYYTASIAIWPTSKAYNNRAACYLKEYKYSAVIADTNMTLALEPDNVKALFRRGVALQQNHKFKEALADMNKVLQKDPKHFLAHKSAEELQKQILNFPNTVRLIDEELNEPKNSVEITAEILQNCNHPDKTYENNEWSLQHTSQKCQLQSTHKTKIIELSEDIKVEKASTSTRLKIIEVEDPSVSNECDVSN